MPILDFTEISKANGSDGRQDSFELFARDCLRSIGYIIERGPDRGQDAGRDLAVQEIRKGVGGETVFRWLVSCKHKAHSGSSVLQGDEPDILERVRQHQCDGFIGFYSTLPSSSLTTRLEGISTGSSTNFSYHIFDSEIIEQSLLNSSEGLRIAERYFPVSVQEWRQENPKPAKLFNFDESLVCECCGRPLLEPPHGLLCMGFNHIEVDGQTKESCEDIYWSCKGSCDRHLRLRMTEKDLMNGWRAIPDLCIPSVYLKFTNSVIFQLQNGFQYSEQYHKKLEKFLIQIFPHIARDLTSKELDRIETMEGIPALLGGLF